MKRGVHEVYAELSQVLESPQLFGLGPQVPPALAERLESVRRILAETLREDQTLPDDDEREHYLATKRSNFG